MSYETRAAEMLRCPTKLKIGARVRFGMIPREGVIVRRLGENDRGLFFAKGSRAWAEIMVWERGDWARGENQYLIPLGEEVEVVDIAELSVEIRWLASREKGSMSTELDFSILVS